MNWFSLCAVVSSFSSLLNLVICCVTMEAYWYCPEEVGQGSSQQVPGLVFVWVLECSGWSRKRKQIPDFVRRIGRSTSNTLNLSWLRRSLPFDWHVYTYCTKICKPSISVGQRKGSHTQAWRKKHSKPSLVVPRDGLVAWVRHFP